MFLCLLCATTGALANGYDTYYVDAVNGNDANNGGSWEQAKQTIQNAVDNIDNVPGNLVLVTNGVYDLGSAVTPGYALTNRVCITKGITVRSVNGPEVTIIKGAPGSNGSNDFNSIRGVFMSGGCSLIGFTVTNGYTMGADGGTLGYFEQDGGGIWLTTNCVVSNCVISGNMANDEGGGAVLFVGGRIENCELSGNTAGNGGGAAFCEGAGGLILNSRLSGNHALYQGGGVQINIAGCEMANCLLVNNHSDSAAGGAVLLAGTLNNCTVYGNQAEFGCGGLMVANELAVINNCIIWSNTAPDFGRDIYYVDGTIRNSCASDGLANGVGGCTTNNPLLSTGYTLGAQSPCLNTGDNTYAPASVSPRDLAGNMRIAFGTVDMGAYEVQAMLSVASGPFVGGNTLTITNGTDFGTITNVLVGGVAAVIQSSGANWVVITVPAVGSAGTVDIVVQTSDNGDATLAEAYTYNPPGLIQAPTIMMEYLISFTGTNGASLDYHRNEIYVTNYTPYAPAGAVYTYVSATNTRPVELAATNRGVLVKNGVRIKLDGFVDSYNGGWNDMAGGLWWLSTNAGQWFVFREDLGDSYVTITNLPGTNYTVEVINAYGAITLRYNQQLHPGLWKPGDPRDIGNWGTNIAVWQQPGGGGNWFSPTNTYWWRDRYIVYSNTVPQDRAMTLVLWDTNGQPCNVVNAMRIRGEEPLGLPVEPSMGSWTGGYTVVISGSNLGDGSDITNVTLCGVSAASIESQSATQVVIVTGQALNTGIGDVRVYSVSYGETVKSNAFTYTGSGILVSGPAFGSVAVGGVATNVFTVTNAGNAALTITAATNDGAGAAYFDVSAIPAQVEPGTASNFPVVFTAGAAGTFNPVCYTENNSPYPNYDFGLYAGVYQLSANSGPYAGGNTLTITNGHFGTITNVLVGGMAAVIQASGDNWVTITVPAVGSTGAKDVVIQTSDNGDTTLVNAYTVNPAGEIAGHSMVEYRIDFSANARPDYPTNTSPDGSYIWTHFHRTNDWKELKSINGKANNAWVIAHGFSSGTSGGWYSPDVGHDWIAAPAAYYQIFSSSAIGTNYVAITNLPGSSYQVDVVNSYNINGYECVETLHEGLYQLGEEPDNGNYGSWPSGGNTNAGLNLVPYQLYTSKTNYVTWTHVVPSNGAISIVLKKQGGVGNMFNCMRIRGDEASSGVSPASGSWTGGYEVVITGTNLGNGSDITNVTLCGVSANSMLSQSATQVVMVAGASSFCALGDVAVHSVSFGTTFKSNAFEYLRETQAPLEFTPSTPQTCLTTNSLSVSGGSGTGAVSYAVQSGPGSIVDGTNLTVTAGSGTIEVRATKAQDDLYYAASVTGTVTAAKAGQIIGIFLPTNGSVFIETDVVGLSATASSGLTVIFTNVSGPGVIAGGTNLSFTGGGLVDVVAMQAGDDNWNAAENVTNTYRVRGYYTLMIESAHGTCTPVVGIYTNLEDSVQIVQVTTPDEQGTTQYLCRGWSMTGHDPVAGISTQVIMTVTNHATLTWLWTTEYYLTPSAGPHGDIDRIAGWFTNGAVVEINATADAYYHFTNWSGSVLSYDNPLNLLMDGAQWVTAIFAENWTTNQPTPQWWLAEYGLTNFEADVLLDSDGDGVPSGDEWIMNTDPTNGLSFLHAAQFGMAYGTNCYDVVTTNSEAPFDVFTNTVCDVVGQWLAWPCATERVYDVEFDTTFPLGGWAPVPGLTNLGCADGWLSLTNALSPDALKMYRLKVRMPGE